MGIILRLIRWGALLIAGSVLGVSFCAAFLPDPVAEDFEAADVIVVFGAGMSADGTLHQPSILRVKRGVELFKAGKAPNMHFTGGRAVPNGPAAGDQMADLAIKLGIPSHVITRENRSQSTLQNALFSQPDLATAQSAILVSEGFHLPRVAAAVLWAGGPSDLQLAISTRFRTNPTRMILREAAAWWFNSARALAYSAAGVLGISQKRRESWLT